MSRHEEKWKEIYRINIVEERKLQCIKKFHEYIRNIRHKHQLSFRKNFDNKSKSIALNEHIDSELDESIISTIEENIQIDDHLSISEKIDVINYLKKTLYIQFKNEGIKFYNSGIKAFLI